MATIDPPQSNVAQRGKLLSFSINLALLIVSALIVAVLAEFVFRHRYGHMLYNPRPAVQAVQQYLTLDPKIGYKWQPNIDAERSIRFSINDITTPPLSTDSFGVMNSPAAKNEYATGGSFDIVGVGDSFMEMAAAPFHERFKQAGHSYYSLAIHRQCPPQYNAQFTAHAPDLQPRILLYGLFENDFDEAQDFQSWQKSGLDWFTYHSGTWCGPPIGVGVRERFLRTHARGWYAFSRVLDAKYRGENISSSGPGIGEIADVADYIANSVHVVNEAGTRFILVIIPSKQTAISGDSLESRAYDIMLELLQHASIEIVDLRKPFHEHPDPASLYYVKDGHWNNSGIALAADIILKHLESKPNES
ncbi:MAG: hypothetical protein IT367_01735 [Candidatus Hydrogenedentes bacterium]|nr:hypothetical protein [Candidatus Hydrogenedentota bacterium]